MRGGGGGLSRVGGGAQFSALNLSKSDHRLQVRLGSVYRCMRVYLWRVNLDPVLFQAK